MIAFIENSTGLQRKLIIKLLIIMVMLAMFFGIGQSLTTNLVGVAYPSFMTFYSIQTSMNDEDDKQWLTYWFLFGLLSIVDQIGGGYVVSLIPFYWVIKIVFLVWLFHPVSLGATFLYDNVV